MVYTYSQRRRKLKIVLSLIFYLLICAFVFPAVHDLFHELGHATYGITQCGSTNVQITLGEYAPCKPTASQLKICVTPAWIYKSLYRQSRTFGVCNSIGVTIMGGIFGLVFSWLLLGIVVFAVCALNGRTWLQSLFAGAAFLFIPFRVIQSFRISNVLYNAVLGFGALIIQWDLINEVFYTFFPSRLVIWIYLESGDGTTLWKLLRVPESTILIVSYVVFVILVLLYLWTTGCYIYFVFNCRQRFLKEQQSLYIKDMESTSPTDYINPPFFFNPDTLTREMKNDAMMNT